MASHGNGKAKENKDLRRVSTADLGLDGCADPPRGSVGGGQDDFDTPTGRRFQIFRASENRAPRKILRTKIFRAFELTGAKKLITL